MKRLAKSEAVSVLPDFILGVLNGVVRVDLPQFADRTDSVVVLTFQTVVHHLQRRLILNPDDWEIIRVQILPSFVGNTALPTSTSIIQGRVATVWPTADNSVEIETAPNDHEDDTLDFP